MKITPRESQRELTRSDYSDNTNRSSLHSHDSEEDFDAAVGAELVEKAAHAAYYLRKDAGGAKDDGGAKYDLCMRDCMAILEENKGLKLHGCLVKEGELDDDFVDGVAMSVNDFEIWQILLRLARHSCRSLDGVVEEDSQKMKISEIMTCSLLTTEHLILVLKMRDQEAGELFQSFFPEVHRHGEISTSSRSLDTYPSKMPMLSRRIELAKSSPLRSCCVRKSFHAGFEFYEVRQIFVKGKNIIVAKLLRLISGSLEGEAPEVSVKYHLGLVDGVVCSAVLYAMADTPTEGPLSTSAATAITKEAWDDIAPYYLIDMAVDWIFIFCLGALSSNLPYYKSDVMSQHLFTGREHVYLSIMALIVTKNLFFELAGLLQRRTVGRGFGRYDAYELFVCGSSALLIAWMQFGEVYPSSRRFRCLYALVVCERWLRALNYLKCLETMSVGALLLPVLKALTDTAGFLLMAVFSTCAFVHAYYSLGVCDKPFLHSFIRMFRLGWLGDFDLEELENIDGTLVSDGDDGATAIGQAMALGPVDPDDSPMHNPVTVLFVACAFVQTILMMNILIGVLGNAYDRFESNSRELFNRQRARQEAVYFDRRDFVRSLCGKEDASGHDKRLLFCMREEGTDDDDDLRSLRGELRSLLKPVLEKVSSNDERLRRIEDMWAQTGFHGRLRTESED